jgi:polyhydroxyalkanoate synthesis regulator phasin
MEKPTTDDLHSAYYEAVTQADANLDQALSHVRAEQDAHRITAVEAAAERVELLERHLELCQQARLEHLGGTP